MQQTQALKQSEITQLNRDNEGLVAAKRELQKMVCCLSDN